jgi:hypothetical protein
MVRYSPPGHTQKEPHAKTQRRKEEQEKPEPDKTSAFLLLCFPLRLCAIA